MTLSVALHNTLYVFVYRNLLRLRLSTTPYTGLENSSLGTDSSFSLRGYALTIEASDNNGITTIAIQGEMTIYTALEQRDQLAEYLKPNQAIQIDLAAVSEIDSAGLQILLWLKQETSHLTLINHSRAVVDVFELLNLTTHFGDPIVLSSHWKTS